MGGSNARGKGKKGPNGGGGKVASKNIPRQQEASEENRRKRDVSCVTDVEHGEMENPSLGPRVGGPAVTLGFVGGNSLDSDSDEPEVVEVQGQADGSKRQRTSDESQFEEGEDDEDQEVCNFFWVASPCGVLNCL